MTSGGIVVFYFLAGDEGIGDICGLAGDGAIDHWWSGSRQGPRCGLAGDRVLGVICG